MTPGRIPLLHITDLYHPPQDPDDQLDLATVVALPEFDLKGVVLDVSQRFLDGAPAGFDIPRDPGFIPVMQLGYLTGRSFPVAVGPAQPLTHPSDDARDRPRQEQAGIDLILEVLHTSTQPVVISVVGSTRALTAPITGTRCWSKPIRGLAGWVTTSTFTYRLLLRPAVQATAHMIECEGRDWHDTSSRK